MANVINSPNMSLPVPVVSQDPGPDYAFNVNAALTLIDAHDHTPGHGVQITPQGLNINTSLTFQGNSALNLASLVLTPQAAIITSNTIYEDSTGDLHYINQIGQDVQITAGNSVAGTSGSITNLVPPAAVTYVPASKTFVFQANLPTSGTAANLDLAALFLRNISPNSTFALLLQPPTLANNYTITLPTIPVLTSGHSAFLTLDTSGNMVASIPTNGADPGALTGSNLSPSAGIVGTQLANGTITSTQIANNTIVDGNIAPSTITGDRLATNTVAYSNIAFKSVSVTASSGAASGGVGPNPVPGLSTTYTLSSSGKYVCIQLVPDGSGNTSFIRGTGGILFIYANGVPIAQFNVGTPSGSTVNLPPGSASHVYDPASTSTVTYSIQQSNIDVFWCRLTVREA